MAPTQGWRRNWEKDKGWHNYGLGEGQNLETVVQTVEWRGSLAYVVETDGRQHLLYFGIPPVRVAEALRASCLVVYPLTPTRLACHARRYTSDARSHALLVKPTPENESEGLFL